MKKQGQGMPMEVIIIAILVIVVLVVLALVFAGKFKIFGTTTKSCSSQGGSCQDPEKGPVPGVGGGGCPNGGAKIPGTECESEELKQICCIDIG